MNGFPPHFVDFYKPGHRVMYPEGTKQVYSNFTPRSDRWASVLPDFDHKVVNFGLQGVCWSLLVETWNKNFFEKPRNVVVERFRRRMDKSLGVGVVSPDCIGELHDLGYLPIRIKALPEGERVDIRIPLWTITNTKPEFFWLTNYLETQLSAECWKPLTSATTAFEYRRLFDHYADMTGADSGFISFQGHDFSMRGMSGIEDATTSGAAHLLSFTGTDTICAIDYLEDYYCGDDEAFIGGSVPAMEHSVSCVGGEDAETETFRRIIQDVYPTGVVSLIADTWDFWHVLTKTSVVLKDVIMGRAGKTVFRPDSGDPVKIIVGDPEAPEGTPEFKGAVECLWEVFGGTYTHQEYKQLDSHVGLIYGDSISLDRAQRILAGLKAKGFSSGNIVFGIGSYTYNLVTRDTFGTAIKATYGVVGEEKRSICKNPKTDNGIKKSAKGLLRVEFENDHYVLYDNQTEEQEKQGLLETVFEDGKMVRIQTLGDIRARLAKSKVKAA